MHELTNKEPKFLEMVYHVFVDHEDKHLGMFWVPWDSNTEVRKIDGIAETEALYLGQYFGQQVDFKWSEKFVEGKHMNIKPADIKLL